MPNREFYFSKNTKIAVILPVIDFVVITVLLAVSAWVYDDTWSDQYAISGFSASFLFIFLGNYFGLFNQYLKPPLRGARVKLISCWFLAFMLTLFLAFLRKNTASHSRVILTMWFASSTFMLYFIDYIWHYLIKKMQRYGRNKIKVAIAGMNSFAFDLTKQIKDDGYSQGVVINGVYDDRTIERLPEVPFEELKLLGSFDDMVEDAADGKLDVLFVTLPFKAEKRILEILKKLANTTVSVYIVPDSFVFEMIQGDLSSYGKIPLIEIFETPFKGINTFIKRVEDIVVTLALMPILVPALSVVAVLVKATSKGPIIFSQKRYGINGDVIKIWKFRSMTVCEDGGNIQQAKVDDKRFTPIGKFIRKTSLDELPQFINVLQGRMSVVGPRPHAVAHNEEYRGLIAGYMMRHKVKPGITGLAQVNGYRGETENISKMKRRVDCDVQYIREWSIVLDLEIILRTVLVVIVGKNAH